MKVVLLEPLGVPNQVIEALSEKLREQHHEFTAYNSVETDVAQLSKRANDADVLIIANNPLPGEVIRASGKLKFISVGFTGIDHVDKQACLDKGIKVANSAGYATTSVAELVIGLIIGKLRNIKECDAAIRQGRTKDGLVGNELAGKTVGIVGTGAIGRKTAQLLKAFDCHLLGYDKYPSQEAAELGIQYVSLEELLQRSDIVSLHAPLTEDTAGLIGAEQLKLLQPHAILVNCARGEIIDIQAAAKMLKERRIGGAAVDVFEVEPPLPKDHVLLEADNAILTPHVAFATKESIEFRAKIAFDNVYAWLEGKAQNIML